MSEVISFLTSLLGPVAQGLIWGIAAIGVYITFKILDYADMTVDGSICTGAATAVMLIIAGVNVYVAMLCAFIAGCLAGLITAFFNTVFGIPAILSGILTQLALYSINLRIMGKPNQAVPYEADNLLVSSIDNGQTIITTLIIIAVLLAILYWVFGTELGCATRATGCNPNMARAQGINTNIAKTFGLVFSNGLVAFSGALLTQYNGFSDINMGRGAIVICLAAVVIGEVIFGTKHGFVYKLVSVVVGTIIYYLVIHFAIQLGLKTDDMKLITAFIVAIFLAVPYLKSKGFKKSVKKGAREDA
jgi:putative ABC transport system permease protein